MFSDHSSIKLYIKNKRNEIGSLHTQAKAHTKKQLSSWTFLKTLFDNLWVITKDSDTFNK